MLYLRVFIGELASPLSSGYGAFFLMLLSRLEQCLTDSLRFKECFGILLPIRLFQCCASLELVALSLEECSIA
jgi:hypothetical protein